MGGVCSHVLAYMGYVGDWRDISETPEKPPLTPYVSCHDVEDTWPCDKDGASWTLGGRP